MSTQRISLNSSTLSKRMRKFDTYHYDEAKSLRRTARPVPHQSSSQSIVASENALVSAKINYSKKSNVEFKQTASYTSPSLSQESKSVHSNTKFAKGYLSPKKQSSAPPNYSKETGSLALHVVKEARSRQTNYVAQQFDTPKSKAKRWSSIIPENKIHRLFYGLGVFVFLFATFASVQTILTNKQAKDQLGVLGEQTQTTDENGVPEGTGEKPSEAPVSSQAIANYTVSPDMPRYIRIPSIGVFSRIKQMGITKDGAVDAPGNINDVGWFNGSAKPGGSVGSSLLVAHVSGWTAPGAFKKINQLKAGMRFEIEKGSGEKITYEVVRGESLPIDKVNMESILNPIEGQQHDLKLMTCSGRFNRQADHYEERYVVYAKILR